MTHNVFTRIDSNQLMTQNGFLKFDLDRLTAQKAFRNFDSNRLMTQKLSIMLIRIKSWLNDSNQLLISLTVFGLSVNFIDLFRNFTKFR